MVKEGRCSMGGGREETCINMGGGNSLWVGETYCGEGKICYYWWCSFSVVRELRCIMYGRNLLW